MAYEIFDDIAFFYLAMAVVAMAVLPWSLFKLCFAISDACRQPQLIPLTRIQKLKLAQNQAAKAAAASASAAAGGVGVIGAPAPVTVQPQGSAPAGEDGAAAAAAAKSNAAASGLTQENLKPPAPWFSCGNVTLALLWVLFIFMLLQIPSFKNENLASFKPFEILGVDPKAGDDEIKKAYRKQSLVYHPDRNPSPEAAQQFILVAKAYETLTSPTAKANIEKYGNPDGYQGVSVTIGLPSMLTKKENEMRVLVVYFFLFIVLPPVIVWLWWRRAKEFVDGGLLKKTLALWYQLMLPNMGAKPLVEFLAIAAENEVLLGPDHPTDVRAFKELSAAVRPQMAKQRFQDAKVFGSYFQYAQKASVLLHAYMLRIKMPTADLARDLEFLLKDAHRLLAVVMDLAMSRGFVRTVFGVFDLMQLLTQGLFPHDSPLMQLPHLTAEDCRKLARKNVKTVHQLLKSPAERLAKCLPDLTAKQWAEIRGTAELVPDVEVRHTCAVEDEEGLYEGDLVTLTVNLERVSFDPDKPDQPESQYRLSQHEGDESTSVAAAEEDEAPVATEEKKASAAAAAPTAAAAASSSTKGKSNKAKFAATTTTATAAVKETDEAKTDDGGVEMTEVAAAAAAAAGEKEKDAAAGVVASPSPSPSASESPRPMTDDEILDSMPMPSKAPVLPDLALSGPSVHSLTFPLPKHERWYVLLVEKSKKADRIVGLQKVSSFFDEAQVQLRFYAPRAKSAKEDGLRAGDADAGVWQYELHAICDSYVGADQVRPFSIKVEKPRHSGEEAARVVAEKVKEEYAELGPDEGEAEEEYDGKWYYAGFESFWELALNALVLGLLCVFIFNFLHSRGYWQKYVQPGTDFVGQYTAPLWRAAYPFLAPVLEPTRAALAQVYEAVSAALHREPFPIHPDDVQIDENLIPGMGQDE